MDMPSVKYLFVQSHGYWAMDDQAVSSFSNLFRIGCGTQALAKSPLGIINPLKYGVKVESISAILNSAAALRLLF
jgi:hypothetical protein